MRYTIRSFEMGDIEGVIDLLEISFDGWLKYDLECNPVQHFYWKFMDNPEKKQSLQVALAGPGVVGVNSEIYCNIKIGDNVYFCSRGTDSAVHPDHRGKGVYKKLQKLKDIKRIESGAYFHYGVSSNPIVKKHQRKERDIFPKRLQKLVNVYDIDRHLKHYGSDNKFFKSIIWKTLSKLEKIFYRIEKSDYRRDYNIYEINTFDERIDKFWDKIKQEYEFIIERKQDYLNWRYCDTRGGNYTIKIIERRGQIAGYAVLRINKIDPNYYTGYVVDFLTVKEDEKAAESLIKECMDFFHENNVNYTSFWIIENHPYSGLFKKHNFREIPQKNRAEISIKNLKIKEDWKILLKSDPDKLFFQYGDADWI